MAGRVEDELKCPTCLSIFKDPVVLQCSHNFCRACVQHWWEEKGERTCPLCRTEFPSKEPPLNLALRNVCEAFSQISVESVEVCRLHKKKLELFCLEHRDFVCLSCTASKLHTGHKFCSINEAVKGHKKELQEGLQDAKETLTNHKAIRKNCIEQATYIHVQREQVECKIKKHFEELRRFLQVEEAARLYAVREEEQKKSRRMKEKIKALGRDLAALSDAIRSTEKQLKSDPVSFMKNFKTAMTRIQKLPDEPELLPRALLDEAKHVGNLKYNVWERMKEMVSYSPVILDPNTAGPELRLSEDLTGVSCHERQQRPKNPESFKGNTVLGSALASGTHTWDVAVGDSADWEVGVKWGDSFLPSDMKACGIGCIFDHYNKLDDLYEPWNPPVKPQMIRVEVDTNAGSVSFSEYRTNTQLCIINPSTWPRLSDKVDIFPYFWTHEKIPLQIIPLLPRVLTFFLPPHLKSGVHFTKQV